uniref:cytochrome c peroxidase n=1 Tax=Thiolapillus sp. TaxID=2017437 RepID=UPI003AF948BA
MVVRVSTGRALLAATLGVGLAVTAQAASYPDIGPLPQLKIDKAKAELGKRLFFDKRLSGDAGIACADCHVPEKAYSSKQACLRPRDRFWDIPVPKIDSAFDNLLVPQPSWSPSTTQQLRKLVAAPYLAPNDWTPRSEAYFVFPLAQGTPGKQCGLAATGVYQPSLRSPWLAAIV